MKLGNAFAVVVLAGTAAAVRADLVTNGGFETGDFTGWTQFGDTSFTGVANDGPFAHSGTFDAFFGPLEPGGIQQTIAASAGQSLAVDFWLETYGSTNTFSADLGGTNLVTLTNEEHGDWTHFSFTVNAPSANPLLTFTFTNPPSFSYLDDVSVNPVPAPGSLALLGFGGLLAARRRR